MAHVVQRSSTTVGGQAARVDGGHCVRVLVFEKLADEADTSEQVSIDSKESAAKYLERMKESLYSEKNETVATAGGIAGD